MCLQRCVNCDITELNFAPKIKKYRKAEYVKGRIYFVNACFVKWLHLLHKTLGLRSLAPTHTQCRVYHFIMWNSISGLDTSSFTFLAMASRIIKGAHSSHIKCNGVQLTQINWQELANFLKKVEEHPFREPQYWMLSYIFHYVSVQ